MPFALTISHLQDMMEQPGCPICRLSHQAADHSVGSFLWENVNDPEIRKDIFASYGFCPAHTRLLVAKELMESATVLGVNIIYEHLGRFIAEKLETFTNKENLAGGLNNLLQNIGINAGSSTGSQLLSPKGTCPICIASDQAAVNGLSDLFEELGHKGGNLKQVYLASDGLCLSHLREGVEHFGRQHPEASKIIIEDTIKRLVEQSVHMKEYIRKNNWQYRDEKLTPDESEAWRKTLTFLTGLPGSQFNHKVEEF